MKRFVTLLGLLAIASIATPVLAEEAPAPTPDAAKPAPSKEKKEKKDKKKDGEKEGAKDGAAK